MSVRTSCLLALLALVALSAPAPVDAAPPPFPGVRVAEAFPGVAFKEPVHVTYAPGAAHRELLFVVQQSGQIVRAVKWRGSGAVQRPTTWLDLSSKVANQQQGGMLGLAFHPQFAQNGRAFVSYVAKTGNTFKLVVSEFKGNGNAANPTERVILEIPKKWAIHQAGTLTFGPKGKLFISVGDGGAKDGGGHPQSPKSLLGKILRIDVDNVPAGKTYGIPADNPWGAAKFAGTVAQEIYAYGFRNPWKIAFDSQGRLWTTEPGTKGSKSREWVHVVQAGTHHGWPMYEGLSAGPVRQQVPNRTAPVFEYVRGNQEGSAGVGGLVYEGARVPGLRGRYLFADYFLGEIYALDVSAGAKPTCTNHRLVGKVPNCAGIGRDADGEVYAFDNTSGKIYTLASK